MEKVRNAIIVICLLLFVVSCGKKPAAPTPPLAPSKAFLVAPAKDAPCTTGANATATQSAVSFNWQKADNADSYEIDIKNLLTGDIQSQPTSAAQVSVTLSLNTPYSWYIVSKSNTSAQTAQSDTWKFYNSGPGVTSYAPFPADLVSPALGDAVTKGTVTLKWSGSDADNDIVSYDVYFGSAQPVTLFKNDVTVQHIDVQVSGSTTYYWKIVTKDSKGNSSISGTFHFSAN
jgi:hypothetical protein